MLAPSPPNQGRVVVQRGHGKTFGRQSVRDVCTARAGRHPTRVGGYSSPVSAIIVVSLRPDLHGETYAATVSSC
jgi:hypothetical protein